MKALLVVNVQNDYFDSTHGHILQFDRTTDVINGLLTEFELVIFTQDCFPEDHKTLQYIRPENRCCLKGTHGADLFSELKLQNIKGDFYIFKKAMDPNKNPVSAFYDEGPTSTGLGEFLKERGVEDLYITGLDEKWSINNTAIDAKEFGFHAVIIDDGCTSSWKFNKDVLVNCFELGIDIIQSWEFPIYKTVKRLIHG